MKKIVKLLTVLGLLTVLVACQATDKEKEAKKSEAPKEINIYLARHGKTMLNTTDRSQGWIDAPLTPAGVAIAEQLGKGLADVKFDAVYSSDSGRAVETATLVLENNGQKDLLSKLTKEKRLREFNFGTFEGMPNHEMWELVAKKQGITLDEFMANMGKLGFVASIRGFADTLHELDAAKLEELGKENNVPAKDVSWQAENYEAVITRANEALNDMVKSAEKNGQENILVTSHGMTIAALVTSLDEKAEVPPTGLKNASVCKLVYKDGKFTVESVNDLSYIEKGAKK
ncbi:probable phosphoglycerate mutase [Pilibacter termitis]|uniref:Probable phosphoglycerate mutase n=1 Tax=Pilibacter termitis TaxID=263852 RepID=A0A1T4P6I6_9ENTE|nr:histidine phosphatase family protein [Pilibacter termitis]SJZ87195.1 probable phosphoglycerate mutase [Pilibacter termitis]